MTNRFKEDPLTRVRRVLPELGGNKAPATQAPKTRVPGAQNMEKVQRHVLKIVHVATGFSVEFPAFLDSFSDAYTSQWNNQEAYGRMDPISTFGATRRNISLAWRVPAESYVHAQENLNKVNALIQFLYPLYDVKKNKDPVINMDPFWRLSFGNLVRDSVTGQGLLGYVNGITFDPEVDQGMFKDKPSHAIQERDAAGNIISSAFTGQGNSRNRRGADGRVRRGTPPGNPQNNSYYPKSFRLNVEFRVLHEHSKGFAVGPPETALVPRVAPGSSRQGGANLDRRKKSKFSFASPKLNFENHPYQTQGVSPAHSSRDWLADIRAPKYVPRTNPDPAVPARAEAAKVVARPVKMVTEEQAVEQGLIRGGQFAHREGSEKKMGYVVDTKTGEVLGAERTE